MINIAEAVARIEALRAERAQLEQAYRTARETMDGTGSYGQVGMRDIENAENAQMVLKNWDDEHGAELAQLVSRHGKHFGPEILDQRV